MSLVFLKAQNEEDYKLIYEYNIDAFSDSPDFQWNLEEIMSEVQDGWEVHSANIDGEVVAAIFVKKEKDALLSKHTSIKLSHQGSGHSHKIKDYIEQLAGKHKAKRIFNYCRIDNFRQYSLNESHGYEKTDRRVGEDGHVVEWEKVL